MKDEKGRRMAVVSAVDEADRHPLKAEGICRRPLKVEKDICLKVAVVPLPGRLGVLQPQGAQTRPPKNIFRFLEVFCV